MAACVLRTQSNDLSSVSIAKSTSASRFFVLLAVIMEKKLAINTGHTVQVRRTLDEAVQEILAEQKYPEDVYWGNIKLVLMFFACSVSFLYCKTPITRAVSLYCCSYFIVSEGILLWSESPSM